MYSEWVKGRFTTTLVYPLCGLLLIAGNNSQQVYGQTGKADPDRKSISQGIGQPPSQAIQHANQNAVLNPKPGIPRSRNSVPQITSLPPEQHTPGYPYFYQPLAIDADGDKLTWTLPVFPAGMMIDPDSGMIVAQSLPPGQHAVSLRVDDGKGGSTSQDFTLSLQSGPVLLSAPPEYTYTGTPYRYDVVAIDPAGTTLHYAITAGPTGMHIDPDSGILEWVADTNGVMDVQIAVSNSLGETTLQSYPLTVMEQNSIAIISNPLTEAYATLLYEYPLAVLDASETDSIYSFNQAPSGMTIDAATGVISWVPADAGNYTVEVVAMNAQGYMDKQTFTLAVSSLEQMDGLFSKMINDMFTRIGSGDLAGAMQDFTVDAQQRLGPLFNELLNQTSNMAADYTAPVRVSINPGMAEYMVRRTSGNGDRVFMITFLRDDSQQWRINDL